MSRPSLLAAALLLAAMPAASQAQTASGVVFHDVNANGVRDAGELGIGGVRVSNQLDIVTTDWSGAWTLPVTDDTIFFVIKPRGWMTPVNERQIPQFYYIHKPNGSPETKFPGVAPTGPLPSSIDFPLVLQEEPDKFKALFFGDTQTRNRTEVDYLTHDVIDPIVGNTDAVFGVTLGDLVFDDLSVLQPYVEALSLIGIPWYSVIGNHDINFDVANDAESDETFNRWFGPAYFSFDHGPVHFVVLDNVWYRGHKSKGGEGGYTGKFGPDQLAWLEKDLAMTPKDKLVVAMMHIPVQGCSDKAEFYRLIGQCEYALSASAHTHYLEHQFIEDPALPKGHHHVINVTACGSWWQGRPDDRGIPHTTMRDGAPNGYSVFSFDGSQYKIEFRAAGAPEEYQMDIHAPAVLAAGDVEGTMVYANVFGGSAKSVVELKFAGSDEWVKMERAVERDPEYLKLVERDKGLKAPNRPLPGAVNSTHLWKLALPAGPSEGVVPIHVRTTDMFGQVYYATRGLRIEKS